MIDENMGECGLCTRQGQLCNSHIIPEFAYKSAYDEKHRLIIFDPCDPDNKGVAQKGIRSSLLCNACEQLINDQYEKPFLNYWREHDVLNRLAQKKVTKLTGIDYCSFKLFHLSVLFRASLSNHPNFVEVDLGPHEHRMRDMLLTNDPGEPWQYLIVCMGVEGESGRIWSDMVGPAHRMRYIGNVICWAYYFTFMGCQWFYYVGSHSIPDIEEIALHPSGTLPVAVMPLTSISHYRKLRHEGRKP